MALPPITIQLSRLNRGHYSTDPGQAPIAEDDTVNVDSGQQTNVDVFDNDFYLLDAGASVSGVSSEVNCTVSVPPSGGILGVTGLSAGVGSFQYTVLDGNGNSDTADVNLSISGEVVTDSVILDDVTSTDFDESLSVSDTITYATTTSSGHGVSVDTLGHITISGGFTSGDVFTYSINTGPTQVYTLL